MISKYLKLNSLSIIGVIIAGIIYYLRDPSRDLIFCVFLVFVSLVYFFFITLREKDKYISGIIFGLVMVVGMLMIYKNYPDKNVFTLTNIEKYEIESRRDYMRIGFVGQIYGRKVGKYYFEKIMIYKSRALRKISYAMDLQRYFSTLPNSLMPYILLPIVFIGLVLNIKKHLGEMFLFFSFATPASLFLQLEKTTIIYLPLIFVMFATGLNYLLLRGKLLIVKSK